MNKAQKLIILIVILAMITLACNSPSGSNLTETDQLATAVAETVSAQMAENLPPEQAQTQPPEATASFTPEPSLTTPPTATATSTATVVSIPCNRASFMTDVTYPDGAEVHANNSFVKTWRLQNTGSCTWTSGYKMIFSHGDRMNAPNEVQLTGGTVAPGETVDVSVNLTAPGDIGTFKGYFKLKSSNGDVFGIGSAGTTAFWVEIKIVPVTLLITPFILTPLVIVHPKAIVTYSSQQACTGDYYLKFRVQNTGTINIESYSITATDLSGSQTTTENSNSFASVEGCLTFSQDPIAPGEVGYLTSGPFNFQMIGSNVTATIRLYPLDDQAGFFTEKTLNFIE